MTYSSGVCINVRTMLFFIKYIRPLCAVKDLINYITHLLVGDKQAAKAFFVPHIALCSRQVSHWFPRARSTQGMDKRPTHWAGAHGGMRKSCDWIPRQEHCWWVTQIALPAVLELHSTEEFKKKKNGHHVTITELLLRLHSVATELHPPLQSRRESNETAQHFLNIFLRLPKGNRRGREIIHPLCSVCRLPPPPRTATVLSRSLRHCNETKLKAISAGKCGHILF